MSGRSLLVLYDPGAGSRVSSFESERGGVIGAFRISSGSSGVLDCAGFDFFADLDDEDEDWGICG